jgi:HK97 gp10 family phage protein
MSGFIHKTTARVETAGFDRLLAMVEEGLDEAMEALADAIVAEAKASPAFKDRNGKLRKTIRKYHDRQGEQWYVRAGGTKRVYHAHLVEFGTRAHAIFSAGKPMHFKVNGKDIFTTRVIHPGAPARPFLAPAADKVLGKGEQVIAKHIERRTAGIEVPIK